MAMLYGEGDLPRTAEIATMAGWDTDCNAGNAGAIVGTFQGVQPGWDKYRKPINDFVVASGVIGTVNVVDIPSFARELTVLALRLDGEEPPALWVEDFERRGVRFDFDAPGSTHGFRTEPFNQIELQALDDEAQAETRAVRSKSCSTGWSAGRAAGCSGSRSIGAPISTTSAIARCSRRWPMTGRW